MNSLNALSNSVSRFLFALEKLNVSLPELNALLLWSLYRSVETP
ncbi:hypothetical protein LEP1GSC158_4854 [Leptospira interrogans serovar Zanoni str. LT2156]|uniref:Uncharacterized protein n=1 Tax=Leptospira interrogans serovar Zanoni str. LT2156 TaxID=1001601 RepID=M6HEV1_LEPIR|nr:hypothetical protein LEP1GSC158_4854 [Leptospira interrogans serovar Zanoni str. LT2156]